MRNSRRNVFVSLDFIGPGNRKTWRKHQAGNTSRYIVLLAAMFFVAPFALAQGSPKVTAVNPTAGKVNDIISIIGENLGKGSVSAVFLSDDKNDSKASVLDQASEKITIKIPQVKSGNYNISVQTGDRIMILPVHFEVQ